MKVRWSDDADHDRDSIVGYIWLRNPQAAARIDAAFDRAADRLSRFPFSGKTSGIAGTRELLPHPTYRLIYSVGDDIVTIHNIVHTSRQWPPDPDATDGETS